MTDNYQQNAIEVSNNRENGYWNSVFADNSEMGGFIPDKHKGGTDMIEFAEYGFDINENICKKIRKISNQSDYGIYAILLSALSFIIYKYSRHDGIVGFPVKFIDKSRNTIYRLLPIRCVINTGYNYKTYLELVGRSLKETLNNKHILLNEIAERKLAYKVVLVLDSIHGSDAAAGLDTDMILLFKARERTIEGCIRYNSGIFVKETIVRIAGYFNKFLEEVLDNPEIALADINILGNSEIIQQLYEYNGTKADYPKNKTIQEIFEEQVVKYPDRTAVSCGDNYITYNQLNIRSNRLALLLRERGVRADSLVGIILEPSIDMVISILGILKAGGAYLPIDPEYPAERIKYILEDSGAAMLITKSSLRNEYMLHCDILELDMPDNEAEGRNECQNPQVINKPDDLAYVIYTSGTTGKPKGVMIEHKNVISLICNDKMNFKFTENDIWTLFHSYCFDFSVWEMFGALFYGGKLVVIPRPVARDTKAYLDLLKKEKVTILNQTPSAFYRLMEEELKSKDKELTVRSIIFGGEALKPMMLKKFRNKYPDIKLINMYGITETTVHVTYKEITGMEIEQNISNIGKPLATLSAYVLDNNMKLVPLGGAGELCVGGEGVGRGYLNKQSLTSEKFIENPYKPGERLYRSGDLVRILYNGDMEYLGRIDLQVKIRGYRIELGEIESHLLKHEAIKEVTVGVREDKRGNKYLCAYMVADGKLQAQALREYLSEELPEYMLPSVFIQLEEMPLNSNGKIDMNKLLNIKAISNRLRKYVEPFTENEKLLVNIWNELFDVDKIGVDDDFINLGGHSLMAVDAVLRIQEIFNVNIPMVKFFQLSTIRNIALYLEEAERCDLTEIAIIDKKEYYPVSSAQNRMFILNSFFKDGTAYNLPYAWTIEGPLDIERFKMAFTELIKRHEALRTSFHIVDGEVKQKIHEITDFKLEYTDAAVQDFKEIVRNFIRPFNLEEPPLIRAKLILNSAANYTLLLDMHHIISDAVSIEILHKELADLYMGNSLPKLRVQYKEYSGWQKSETYIKQLKEQEKYWLSIFADGIPVLNMPLDHARSEAATTEGRQIFFSINYDLYMQLEDFSLQNNFTMFTILFAAYIILLSEYTGQNDIVVGIPVAGRRHKDIKNVIGMFVNTLAIRSYLDRSKTVFEFIDGINNILLNAYENQDYPFEDLVDKLKIKRDFNRNPIFDTMFNLLGKPEIKIDGLKFTRQIIETKNSLFEIELDGEAGDNSIDFCLCYNASLYNMTTMKRFSAEYLEIVRKILNHNRLEEIAVSNA